MRRPNGLPRDLFYAFRTLRRGRATSLLAVLTLALGTGAVAGVWAVASPILGRHLPYPDASSLALVWRTSQATDARRLALSPPDFVDVRERATAFEALAAMNSFTSTLQTEDGGPEQIQLGVVSGDFFRVFGVPAGLGRVLEPGDDRRRPSGNSGPLVLAHELWTQRFGADPDVVGRTVVVGSDRMTIVGVMPAGFRLHLPAGAGMSSDLAGWTPLGIDYATAPRDGAYLKVIGRVRPGIAVEAASAEVAAIAASLRDVHASHAAEETRFRAVRLQDEVVEHVRWSLVLLGAAGVLVLLVACGNVAGLLLVRFLARRGELGTRVALGATRGALARQLVAEAVLLATAGTAAGMLLARAAVPLLLRLEPGVLPRLGAGGVDPMLLLVMAGAALVATFVGGALPAFLAARGATAGVVRGNRDSGASTHRARGGVVVAQLALGFALLYGGVSLGAAALDVRRQDLGFDTRGALTFSVTLPFASYRGEQSWLDFHERFADRLAALPAVRAVGLASGLPLVGDNSLDAYAIDPAFEELPWGTRQALFRVITPGYLEAAGIRLVEGRDVTAADRAGAPVAVLVDRALAARLQPLQPGPVIGRRLDVAIHEFRDGYRVRRDEARIVGVVESVAHEHPRADPPGALYISHQQQPLWGMNYVVRGAGAAPSAAAVRQVLADLDPTLALHRPRPFDDVVAASLSADRFLLALVGAFAGVVVALGLVGLYALLAEMQRQRRRETGIRLALGARPLQVARRVLLSAAGLAAAGAAAGVLLVPGAETLLARAVPFREPVAPGWLLTTALLLVAGAVACSAGPARRAARLSPVEALRE